MAGPEPAIYLTQLDASIYRRFLWQGSFGWGSASWRLLDRLWKAGFSLIFEVDPGSRRYAGAARLSSQSRRLML